VTDTFAVFGVSVIFVLHCQLRRRSALAVKCALSAVRQSYAAAELLLPCQVGYVFAFVCLSVCGITGKVVDEC